MYECVGVDLGCKRLGERREGDGSRRLLLPLVGVGRELVSTCSDSRLLSSISAGLLK